MNMKKIFLTLTSLVSFTLFSQAPTIQWAKCFGGSNYESANSIVQTVDGGYIFAGHSRSTNGDVSANYGNNDYWIVKIDDIGGIEWQRTYGGNGDNQLYVIHQTQDGGYIAGGNSNSTTTLTSLGGTVSNGTDYWVIKMDENGTIVWSETYDFGKVDILTSLVENEDRTILIGGYAQNESSHSLEKGLKKDEEGINDYIALKIDEKGEVLWDKSVGSEGEDILRKLITTRDGGYLMAGTSNAQSASGPCGPCNNGSNTCANIITLSASNSNDQSGFASFTVNCVNVGFAGQCIDLSVKRTEIN